MFKSFIAIGALAVSSLAFTTKAQAEVYNCIFTEPFVTVTYDSSTEDLKIEPALEKPTTLTGILFRPHPMTGEINLVNSKGVTLFTLTRTGTASDGMSDFVYPYEALVKSSQDIPVGYYGACDTAAEPRFER